ncbi:g9864 [Coccomyxa elongata]
MKVLVGLVVSAFVAYTSVFIALNTVLLSSIFQRFTSICYFPYITKALKKGPEVESFAFLKEDRLYSAAVYSIWGLTFLAALLTIALRNLPSRSFKCSRSSSGSTEPLLSRPAEELSKPHAVAKRILHYHLPPRGFWSWWSGGMAVYDALVVVAWITVNILYVQQRVSLILPIFKQAIAQGLLPDWSSTQALVALISGALGWAATLDILLLFYPVPRSIFLHWLMGTNFPTLIKYHRWLGHGTMWILSVHGCGFYALWLWEHDWLRGLVWDRNGTNMLAGTLSWLSGCALWFTSLEYVRRNYFELFYKTHILGFLGFMLFGFMHHVSLWAYTMPGLLLYLLDVTLRMAQQVQPVRITRVGACPSATLATLEFNTDPYTPVKPVQDLFLGVDGLSTVQWHPYSTVGGPRPGTLVAHIKSYGSWTSGLMRRLLRDGSVTMRIDGPYGEFEERPEWTRHRTLAIFAGGIGVTPVFGILNDLTARRAALAEGGGDGVPVPDKVIFIFSAAQKNELALLQRPLVADAMQEGWLELDAYYTGANRGKDPSDLGPRPPKPDEPLILPNDSAADLTSPPSSRLAVAKTGAVDDAVTRTVLPPYFFGDAHWAAAHVLCLAGAVLGGIAAFAYSAHANTLQTDGAPDWLIGLYLLLGSSLGGMLLPAVIIIPAHIIRARSVKRMVAAGAVPVEGADVESRASIPEVKATPGRPDIHALLRQICTEHESEQEIGVIAAGPELMVEAVVLACHVHNDSVGLLGRPYLDVSKHTFSL